MKRAFTAIVVFCLMLLSIGCQGVKFLDRNINLKLSEEMLGRSLFTDTEILKRHLEEVPGYIAVDKGNGTLEAVLPLQTGGFIPPVTAITDDKSFYHSVIDQTAGAQGSYLSILSVDLTAKQTAEVLIKEAAEAWIPRDKVPWQAIAEWGRNHPPRPGEKRFYVQGALLSTVSKTVCTEISANATVDGGIAFGAKGKVYGSDKNTQTSNHAYIGTHLLDVDAIVANPPTRIPQKGEYEVKVGKNYKSKWPKP
jgi:hypothetical protein